MFLIAATTCFSFLSTIPEQIKIPPDFNTRLMSLSKSKITWLRILAAAILYVSVIPSARLAQIYKKSLCIDTVSL